MFGPLGSLSLSQLLDRAEMRRRMILLGIGDAFYNEFDILTIHDEIYQRREVGRPIS
jgi:hypothetical protein